MIQNDVLAKFKEIFGDEGDIRVYFAPGRVNLIGEHTDYNGGHVFPCALTIGTYMAARKRTDRKLRFYSMNFDELGVIESSLDAFTPDPDGLWTNYPMGVMWAFEGRGMKLETGLDIALFGNIPNGSGLSSSASLEVVTGYMLKDLYGFDVTNQDLALIGQYSENNYNGCNCGIMDQFASAMGKKDNAIFLDTSDLSFEYAPIVLDGAKIVVTNSMVKHSLVTSAYNDRRNESAQALKDLQTVVDIVHPPNPPPVIREPITPGIFHASSTSTSTSATTGHSCAGKITVPDIFIPPLISSSERPSHIRHSHRSANGSPC